MTNHFDKIIRVIGDLLGDRKLSTAEALDVLENVRDYIEPWIYSLNGDLDDKADEREGA